MQNKKKILIIIPYLPYPPHNGGAVRIFNLIKNTYMHSEISLIFPLDKKFTCYLDFLKPFCKNIFITPRIHGRTTFQKFLLLLNFRERPRLYKKLLLLFYGVPFSLAKFYQIEITNKLKDILSKEEYDIIQFEYISMSIYLKDIIGFIGKAKSILVEHDIFSIQQKRRLKYTPWYKKPFVSLDYLLTLLYERRIIPRFDHVITMSEFDKKKLISFGLPDFRISVIKNGADINNIKVKKILHSEYRVVFLGSMAFTPNKDGLLWFLDKVFPIITSKVKEVTLVVIGENDSNMLNKYKGDKVIFRGIVDNLDLEMGKGTVFIAPLRIGAGTKLKILTAMAYGMPIVTTSVGIEGIFASEKDGIILADTENDFAIAVINLLRDKEKRLHLGENARRFVENNYSWSYIANELLLLYNSI